MVVNFYSAITEIEKESGLLIVEWVGVLESYVTSNHISVTHVKAQMCRRTEEEVVPTVRLATP